MSATFLDLVGGRRGHFRLESGYHGEWWLDLDALFADTQKIEPIVGSLVASLREFDVSVVCGPLLGGAFLAQLAARELGVEFAYTEREVPPAGDGLFRARYLLPGALVPRVAGKRCAVVDDVMSTGSALRATFDEIRACGGVVVVAGALLVLGSVGADFFALQDVPIEAVARQAYRSWLPEACPLCASGIPLDAFPGLRRP